MPNNKNMTEMVVGDFNVAAGVEWVLIRVLYISSENVIGNDSREGHLKEQWLNTLKGCCRFPPPPLCSLSTPHLPSPTHCYLHHLQYFYDTSCLHSHILHVHVYIVPTMLTELLYPRQYGYTALHLALRNGHTTCVESLLSTPGIDVNIGDKVSCYTGW